MAYSTRPPTGGTGGGEVLAFSDPLDKTAGTVTILNAGQAPAKGRVHVDDYGAVANGVATDNWQAFNDAVGALPASGGVVELGAGCYFLSAPWDTGTKRVVIEGKGSSTIAGTTAEACTRLTFYGTTGIVVSANNVYRDFNVEYGENTNLGVAAAVTTPVPSRQWRPLRSTAVGTSCVPIVPPNHFTEREADRPVMFGWAYMCTRAAGLTTPGTLGTSGSTTPPWRWRNPKTSLVTATVDTGTNVVSATGHGLVDGDQVRFVSDGVLPPPLVAGTNYFVRDSVANVSFKVSATDGGAAIDILVGASGSLHCYIAQDMRPIVDGNLEWTPILAHGFEVKATASFHNIHVHHFPGNAFNVNAAVLYADVPNTADPRLGNDYSNASLCVFNYCIASNCGGTGLYLNGYDTSVIVAIGFNGRENHGYGIYDHSAFGGTFIGCHFDGNEAGYAWTGSGAFYGCYSEASDPTFGAPVIIHGGSWRDGIAANFSGLQASPAVARTAGMTVTALTTKVAPTVEMGWHFISWTSGVTPTPGTFTANAATNVIAQAAHGYSNGWVIYLSNSGGSLPGGLSSATPYYVVNKNTNDYQLSLTSGGAAIDITSAGTGTHTAGVEPTWKPGVTWFHSPLEQGISLNDDEYALVKDGSATWLAWSSSEVSDGTISLKDNASFSTTFINRTNAAHFMAAGSSSALTSEHPNAVFGWDGGEDNLSAGHWHLATGANGYIFIHNGSGSRQAMWMSGDGLAHMPAGRIGFTHGVYLGGSSLAEWPLMSQGDAAPSASANCEGSITWHADGTIGQPEFWRELANGTQSEGFPIRSNAASGTLTFTSTSHATKGSIYLGSSTGFNYDETNKLASVGAAPLDMSAAPDGGGGNIGHFQMHSTHNGGGWFWARTSSSGVGARAGFVVSSDTGSQYGQFTAYSAASSFTRFGRSMGGYVALQAQDELAVGTTGAADLVMGTNDLERLCLTAAGSVVIGTAAIATNATDGFLYVPACAGTPTGTPTAKTGRCPIVVDSTNHKLYFYDGTWRDAGP